MLKITEEHYNLPIVEALSCHGFMDTGTTRPINVLGVDTASGDSDRYVVKLVGSQRMSRESSCRELLGSWMARELDISVLEPVLVNLSEDFVQTMKGDENYYSAVKSVGINFATKYETGCIELVLHKHKMDDSFLEQAKMIFAFDMLIQNADRRTVKPNLLTKSGKLIVLDHELAFSYFGLIGINSRMEPWIVGNLTDIYSSHVLYNSLRGASVDLDFDVETERLTLLNESFWQNAKRLIPNEWISDQLSTIKYHTEQVIEHKEEFSRELSRIIKL